MEKNKLLLMSFVTVAVAATVMIGGEKNYHEEITNSEGNSVESIALSKKNSAANKANAMKNDSESNPISHIKDISLTENDLPETRGVIANEIAAIDSEIGKLFLKIEGVNASEIRDFQNIKDLNEEVSQFYVDHEIIEMINNGNIHGADRKAISKIFEYTTKLREEISRKSVAKLRTDIENLKSDIQSGELPMPEPLTVADKQMIEKKVKDEYENRLLERISKREKEDEELNAEDLALLN